LNFALPAIVLATDRRWHSRRLRVSAVLRRSRVNVATTLIAAFMLIAAGFAGRLASFCAVSGSFSHRRTPLADAGVDHPQF